MIARKVHNLMTFYKILENNIIRISFFELKTKLIIILNKITFNELKVFWIFLKLKEFKCFFLKSLFMIRKISDLLFLSLSLFLV